jgi:hypoxanthine phosphoribosyltransferase
MQNKKPKPIFSEEKIQQRVSEIGGQISNDYRQKTLHIVGILEDAFIFMADLVRAISCPVFCHFLKTEIHDVSEGRRSIREVIFTPRIEAKGKDILLVDGVLDSGVTLDYLVRYLGSQNPSSLRAAVLADKKHERKVEVPADYVAFEVGKGFLVGYGLGYKEQHRNLPYLGTL